MKMMKRTRKRHIDSNCQCAICRRKREEKVVHKVSCQCRVCKNLRGEPNPEQSERMKKNNPMKRLEVVAKFKGNRNPAKQPGVGAKISRSRKKYFAEHPEAKIKMSERFKDDKNPMKRPEIVAKVSGENSSAKRPEVRMKIRETVIKLWRNPEFRVKNIQENHWNWQGGIKRLPYAFEFDENLKLRIRQRDNFTCQFCGAVENGRAFDCHHIDYDKKNSDELNLISLCSSCHGKTGYKKDKWQFLFETLQEIRLVK